MRARVSRSAVDQTLSLAWLAGQSHLSLTVMTDAHRDFEMVHACELLDPTEFIDPGAIILLTGMGFRGADDPDAELRQYVRRVADVGVVGLGFGVGQGLAFAEIPPALTAACREEGISLFRVPRPTPFVSIVGTVHSELARRRLESHTRLLDAQERLNKVAPRGLDELLAVAGDAVGCHLTIVDSDLRIAAERLQPGEAPLTRDDIREVISERGFGGAAKVGELTVLTHLISDVGERRHGIVGARSRPFSSPERAVIRHAAGLASLILQRPRQLHDARQELNSLALAIQVGQYEDSETLARIFHDIADAEGKVRPVLLKAATPRQHDRSIAALGNSLADRGRLLCSLRIDDSSSLILFRGTRGVTNTLAAMMPARASTRVVVGSELPWWEVDTNVIDRLERTAVSLQPGEAAGPDAFTLGWVAADPVHDVLVARARDTWDKLDEWDREHGTEISVTLEAYLRSGGNISHVAEQQATHRHTVRRRLAQAKEVLELNTDDPAVAAELLITAIARAGGARAKGKRQKS